MAHHGEEFIEPEVIPADPAKIGKIWKTAGILALITAIEFVCAFTMEKDGTLITIYILLTLLKAYFIMAEFMHLGHERKSLQLSILLPLIFIAWGIVAMLQEASDINTAITTWYDFLVK
ncbi:MAG: cytochrome C oxidase subunit IV family protein [Cytophagales bacterium]|nr:cytochrome C oxidase subunit IV family protein [Cytophagales bacterium]